MQKEQIDRLYDYTKFHIGMYTALITAVIAIVGLGVDGPAHINCQMIPYLKITLFCFALAGIAGGVIASTISVNSDALLEDKRIGPLGLGLLKATGWTAMEHWAFWLGVGNTLVGFWKFYH